MCLSNKFPGDAAGPGTTPREPPSPAGSLPVPLQAAWSRKQASFSWMHLTHGLPAPRGHAPHLPDPERSWAHLSLSSEFAAARTLLLPSLATPKPLSPSTHVAFCLLLFSLSLCVSSHPSLSARLSHAGFLWHLSIVFIHLTVQIFTFLKPSVFSCFLLLQPNKDFPLKSTHS